MLSWRTEWRAIAERIRGLREASDFFMHASLVNTDDIHGVIGTKLLPDARDTYKSIVSFFSSHGDALPPSAVEAFDRFEKQFGGLLRNEDLKSTIPYLKGPITALVSLRAELDYQLSDLRACSRINRS